MECYRTHGLFDIDTEQRVIDLARVFVVLINIKIVNIAGIDSWIMFVIIIYHDWLLFVEPGAKKSK